MKSSKSFLYWVIAVLFAFVLSIFMPFFVNYHQYVIGFHSFLSGFSERSSVSDYFKNRKAMGLSAVDDLRDGKCLGSGMLKVSSQKVIADSYYNRLKALNISNSGVGSDDNIQFSTGVVIDYDCFSNLNYNNMIYSNDYSGLEPHEYVVLYRVKIELLSYRVESNKSYCEFYYTYPRFIKYNGNDKIVSLIQNSVYGKLEYIDSMCGYGSFNKDYYMRVSE